MNKDTQKQQKIRQYLNDFANSRWGLAIIGFTAGNFLTFAYLMLKGDVAKATGSSALLRYSIPFILLLIMLIIQLGEMRRVRKAIKKQTDELNEYTRSVERAASREEQENVTHEYVEENIGGLKSCGPSPILARLALRYAETLVEPSTHRSSKSELTEFAKGLRLRIKYKMGALFRNKNSDYASVIVAEFLREAQDHVHIYCGCLAEDVYAPRLADFAAAIARGVKIKVLTACPFEQIKSKELAEFLDYFGCIRCNEKLTSPHSMEADGTMFRLETNGGDKTAIVCAYVKEYPYNEEIMHEICTSFSSMWNSSEERASEPTKA